MRLGIVIVAALVAAGWLSGLRASTAYFVSTSGNDLNDCLTMGSACRNIAMALGKISTGDIIIVAEGIYTENLTLNKDVTLVGFGQETTTISGGGNERVMTVTAGVSADVSNLTFTNGEGNSPLWTAGIYVSGTLHIARSQLVATNDIAIRNDGVFQGTGLRISGNSGGVWNTGVGQLRDSSIESNHFGIRNYGDFQLSNSRVISGSEWASPGAGIANFGLMTIDRSAIQGNRLLQAHGAGIYNAGILTISNSRIADNTAVPGVFPASSRPDPSLPADGGGIYNGGNSYATLLVSNSVIFGNVAGAGDQLFNGGLASLTNVTASGSDGESGIHVIGIITLANVTISNMSAGVAVWGSAFATNVLVDAPCILGTMTSLGHNLESGSTCGFTATGDLTNTNPLLGPLQDNGGPTPTYALLPGSPAINTGDNANCPATDQRGVPRPQAGRCDIGAYEYVFPVETYLPFVAR